MIININAKENSIKSGLIGTISEEGSHIINGVEGRQIETGTEEKGLESTGRATNSYFQDKYKDDKTTISMKSDGAIDTSKLGTHVGDDALKFKLNGNITVGAFTPEVSGAVSLLRNPNKKNEVWLIFDIGGDVKLENAIAKAGFKFGLEYYPGVITKEELNEKRTEKPSPVVSELLTQAIQILTKNPHFNSSLGILKNKQGSNKTAGGFLNVGMSVGLKNPLLPEKISIDLEKIIKKEIENAIKSQLKLSKITDSKKVNLKIQKAIKVPDKIAKFLNLLPDPSNWWRAIIK